MGENIMKYKTRKLFYYNENKLRLYDFLKYNYCGLQLTVLSYVNLISIKK